MEQAWYVIRSISGKEKKVKQKQLNANSPKQLTPKLAQKLAHFTHTRTFKLKK